MTRQEALEKLESLQRERELTWKLVGQTQDKYQRQLHSQRHTELQKEEIALKKAINQMLPITIEGWLADDSEEVDRDEHGSIREIFYYLGCPRFDTPIPSHNIKYESQQDLTGLFQDNVGKYLKVTIEAVEIGDRKKCEICEERFRCLTSK